MRDLLAIQGRVLEAAEYFVDNKSTVRDTAKAMGCSKSTTYLDLTEKLPTINQHLSQQVRDLLDYNNSVKHIRGGLALGKKTRAGKEKGF